MSERTPFSTWHVVLLIFAIILGVLGAACLTYGITQTSLHTNREKHWSHWFFIILGAGLMVVALIMIIVYAYWHYQNRKHCKSGYICMDGQMKPACGTEAVENKHVHTPLLVSKGPATQQMLPGHLHERPEPVAHTTTSTHYHVAPGPSRVSVPKAQVGLDSK